VIREFGEQILFFFLLKFLRFALTQKGLYFLCIPESKNYHYPQNLLILLCWGGPESEGYSFLANKILLLFLRGISFTQIFSLFGLELYLLLLGLPLIFLIKFRNKF
jgi:hypothetical protein